MSDKIAFDIPEGGMAVWCEFNKKFPLAVIQSKAMTNGLYVFNANYYDKKGECLNATRLGFASLNQEEIIKAVDILKLSINA